jgi:two-component system, sensor histidine kinase and response regulator
VLDKTLTIIRSEKLIAQQNSLIRDLNKELVQKAAKLELANRELESFNYTVAHDLRSPMVCIDGYSQLLLDKHASDLDDRDNQYLEIINQEINRMNGLIDVLLKFSMNSQKQVEKKWTSLSGIAHEVMNTLLLQEPTRKVTFCIGDEINGYGEPGLLQIVLENLLGNAWKYSTNRENARIEFGTINQDDDLVYFVRDNGAGFDQQDSDKLFTPFQRLQCDDKVEGFGIGLATVNRIIHRHGGRIWAEGAKGKRATFFFTL